MAKIVVELWVESVVDAVAVTKAAMKLVKELVDMRAITDYEIYATEREEE